MTGAECLLRTLLNGGIDTCFMNPGTSEMQFVAALDRVPEMRGVLCLFESVCSGAADGYARMLRKPASTLLHLGPGLANGLSNFHNARKARSPIVNIVGEHATHHMAYDAPLTADTELFARTVSGWVRTLPAVAEMGAVAAEAIAAAMRPPGQVASLMIPADYSWSASSEPGTAPAVQQRKLPSDDRIQKAAALLKSGKRVGLLLGDSALLDPGIEAASRLGVPVFSNRYSARFDRGGARFAPVRIPYFPEPAEKALDGIEMLILVESQVPVSFFGYPNRRSIVAPETCEFFELAALDEDGTGALQILAEGRPPAAGTPQAKPELPRGASLSPATIGQTIAALLPDNAIISDEMVSAAEFIWVANAGAAPHSHLPVTGGSIGQGLPVALGAAVACPDRKVIALEADGSAMYSLQALWTMAREKLDVAVVIFANHRYQILDIEMQRTGAGGVGPRANDMIDISRPDLDFVKMSEAMGVPAVRATTADEFSAHFARIVKERGPALIEAVY